MTYGDYSFSPVPFITLTKDIVSSKEGTVSHQYRLQLDGTLTPLPDNPGGYSNIDTLQDDLLTALNEGGKPFTVSCDGSPLLACYPMIDSINFNPTQNNWVYTCDYNITLSFVGFSGEDDAPYVDSVSENWQVELQSEQHYYSLALGDVTTQYGGESYVTDSGPYTARVTHQVEAIGNTHYSSSGTKTKEAWEYAKDWVTGRLGFDNTVLSDSGVINFDVTDLGLYNHVKATTRSETEGKYGVTETWLVLATGSGVPNNALEDFTIEMSKNTATDITTVNINGMIYGLETISYGSAPGDYGITTSKISSAETYWNVVKTRLLPRAQLYSQSDSTRPLNSTPLSRNVGYSVSKGTISYAYSYDDRPSNCISGALTESINISDTNQADLFASVAILGRTAGPVLQSLGTVSAAARTVVIECMMSPSTGCTATLLEATKPTSQVATILCSFETALTGTYSQVFKQADSEQWSPKTGKYSRSVTWVYQSCSGTPSMSMC